MELPERAPHAVSTRVQRDALRMEVECACSVGAADNLRELAQPCSAPGARVAGQEAALLLPSSVLCIVRIMSPIGRGGMATVTRHRTSSRRFVSIKVSGPSRACRSSSGNDFVREARIAADYHSRAFSRCTALVSR